MSKTILLTGANRGIGFATAKKLLEAGHRMVVTARTRHKADATVRALRGAVHGAEVEGRAVELASQASIRALADGVRKDGLRLDVLVHNAGMLFSPPRQQRNADGVETVLFVNAVAPWLLTRLLVDAIRRPGRVIALGSSLHRPGMRGTGVDFRFGDPHMDAHYHPDRAYKNSKLALIWVMRQLDDRLRGDGIRCDVISPGFVPTTVAEGVTGIKRFFLSKVVPLMPVATSLDDSSTNLARLIGGNALDDGGGRYFQRWIAVPPSDDALDDDKARRFWDLAEQWVVP